MSTKNKIILGIDPGYGLTGYGLIVVAGSRIKALDYGVIETSNQDEFPGRLKTLHQELTKIIKKYKPDIVAVEELFFYKNVTTAIKVGQARGVIILSAVLAHVPVVEFTPLQVKQAISSYGRAGKNQVQQMVKVFLSLDKIPKPDDAADALAVAICAANSVKFLKKISQ
ncbi:MAG: Crossover junction endodeoxyribonuclease RuvC [Parcubacteria group bacterium GW2011_GWC2_39_14]|nr:MAG: Crossover junction endodeoxyribonuclease RuvC [Parcubacteria group bacterium GW2011_GWC2_39_14]KKR55277.1 MAG: Crossover junction endodeoxyribonuclease RuvC [Parcubacteria group bacterium GW2011_GWA2_40_23]